MSTPPSTAWRRSSPVTWARRCRNPGNWRRAEVFLSVGIRVKTKDQTRKVKKAADKATFRSLGHAGAAIRLTARRSIRKNPRKSTAGSAPNTRKGQLKKAIVYAVEKASGAGAGGRGRVLIGPDYEVVGSSGAAHEFGGFFRGQMYPQRPFMGPALEKVKDRLPDLWAASIR